MKIWNHLCYNKMIDKTTAKFLKKQQTSLTDQSACKVYKIKLLIDLIKLVILQIL